MVKYPKRDNFPSLKKLENFSKTDKKLVWVILYLHFYRENVNFMTGNIIINTDIFVLSTCTNVLQRHLFACYISKTCFTFMS